MKKHHNSQHHRTRFVAQCAGYPHQVCRVPRVGRGGGRIDDVGEVRAEWLLRRPRGRAAPAAAPPIVVLLVASAAPQDDHATCRSCAIASAHRMLEKVLP